LIAPSAPDGEVDIRQQSMIVGDLDRSAEEGRSDALVIAILQTLMADACETRKPDSPNRMHVSVRNYCPLHF
jgi:hypothetical protein